MSVKTLPESKSSGRTGVRGWDCCYETSTELNCIFSRFRPVTIKYPFPQLKSPYFRKIISYSIITFYYLSLGWTWWFCVFRIFLNLFCKIRIFLEYLVKSKSQKNSEIAIIQMVIPVTFLPNKIFCSPLPSSKVWDFWKNNSLSGCP